MDSKLKCVQISRVPIEAIELVRNLAVCAGHNDSDAAVMRYALIEIAKTVGYATKESQNV